MANLAEKFLHDHNHPLTKVPLNRTKLFLLPSTNDDYEKCVSVIETSLLHDRVERRCSRAKGFWLPFRNLVQVTKFSGSSFSNFGFQDKTGKFLYPEEALFLLETNKLEILRNEIPISIQEGYEIFLGKTYNSHKYSVYKKLTLQGYKLLRKLKSESCKRKCDESSDEPDKKICKVENNSKINEIFAKLRQKAPKNSELSSGERRPDYFGFLPTNLDRTHPDFQLFISYDENLADVEFNSGSSNVYALPLCGNLTFYKINQVNIPTL